MKRKNLKFNTVGNIRDLGGIPTKDGRMVKSGMFLRSGNLYKLSRRDAKKLAGKYGVKTVIDLRTAQERKEKPDRSIPCALLFQTPIFDEQTSGISHEKDRGLKNKVKAIPDMPALYRKMVTDERYVANLREIMSILVRETLKASEGDSVAVEDACGTGGPAVLYHCTAGKDRTGIISLLLLSMLGVSEEEIMKDYLLTNSEKVPGDSFKVKAVSVLVHDKEVTKALKKVFRAEPEYLQSAIDAINETYGSMEAFLTGPLNISPELQNKLRANSCY